MTPTPTLSPLDALRYITTRLNDDWTPATPDDLIGSSRAAATLIQSKVRLAARLGHQPFRLMINGDPGLAKSALARYAAKLLGAHPKWSTRTLSGTQVKVELLDDISRELQLCDLFGGWRVLQIEEADRIAAQAQVRFLLLLDKLPPRTAVLCTSNCKLKDFEPRFHTRFEPVEIERPSTDEVNRYLAQFPVPQAERDRIAAFTGGNIRAALLDIKQAVEIFNAAELAA